MSYYTQVNFGFSDGPPAIEEVLKIAKTWLETQNRYSVDDVLDDLSRAWMPEGKSDFNGLISQDIEGLMTCISAQYSHICFYVRGMGEEFSDVWLRQFEEGKITRSIGPFE